MCHKIHSAQNKVLSELTSLLAVILRHLSLQGQIEISKLEKKLAMW